MRDDGMSESPTETETVNHPRLIPGPVDPSCFIMVSPCARSCLPRTGRSGAAAALSAATVAMARCPATARSLPTASLASRTLSHSGSQQGAALGEQSTARLISRPTSLADFYLPLSNPDLPLASAATIATVAASAVAASPPPPSVVASLSCGRSSTRRRASRSGATVMAPPVLDSTPGDAAMFGCVHWTRRASPVRVALGHYYLHNTNAA